jgi:hypothetical protein
VVRDERERAGRGRFRGDHSERLREDRGDGGDVGQRDQLGEVPVLERPGEERAWRSSAFELLAIVAEADYDRARVHIAECFEQHVHALVPEQLSEVEDGRLVVGEEGLEPLGVPLVGKTLVRVARIRRVGTALLDQCAERIVPVEWDELVDVDPRRDDVDAVDVAHDVLEHLADVLRPDEDGLGSRERLSPPAR